MTKKFMALCRTCLWLHVGGLLCVLMLWVLFGAGDQGLGPYFEAVGWAAISPMRLVGYTLLIMAYSASVEWVLRLIQGTLQARLITRHARLVALLITATLYGLTHSTYHLAGVLYATALGLWTSWVFARVQSKQALVLWHVQWNLVAITGALLLVMLVPGEPRAHMLLMYKLEQIERGDLVRHPLLGWIDRSHYDRPMYGRIEEHMRRSLDKPLTLHGTLHTALGTDHAISKTYRVARAEAWHDATMRHAVTCSILLDFNDFHETQQGHLGWWSGLALSAHQADDLSAVWALCLDEAVGRDTLGARQAATIDREEIREEVLALVKSPLTLADLMRPRADEPSSVQRWKRRVQEAEHAWQSYEEEGAVEAR